MDTTLKRPRPIGSLISVMQKTFRMRLGDATTWQERLDALNGIPPTKESLQELEKILLGCGAKDLKWY